MKFSILTKMLAITGATLFCGAFVLTIYIYDSQANLINTIQLNQKEYINNQLNRTEKESLEEEDKRLKQLVSILSGSIGNALYALDKQSAKDTITSIYKEDNIKAIIVYDKLSKNNFLVKIKEKGYKNLPSIKNNLKYENEIIGTLEIFYDNSFIIQKINELKNKDLANFEQETKTTSKILKDGLQEQIIWFVVWSLLIMFLLAFSLVRFVNKPLQKFKKGLESFFKFLEDSRNSVEKIDIKSNDEFGAMSQSTNKSINISMQLHSEITHLMNVMDKNIITSETDDNGIITYVSDAFCQISGYSREELLGKSHRILRHPDMKEEIFVDLWETITANKVWKGEIKNRKKDGGYYWVDATITPKCTENGVSCGYTAVRQDITAKKEVEELSRSLEEKIEERTYQLKQNQEQFASMVSNVPGAIYRAGDDSAWPIYYFSDEIENITGYSAKDFMESKIQTFSTIMYPDDIEPIGKIIQEQFEKGKKFQVDYRIVTKNGDIKWVRSQGQSIKSETGEAWIDGVLIDITEQKELENQITQNQEQMTFVAQYANLGFWTFNPQIGDLLVNDIFVEMLGYNPKDVLEDGYENEMFKPFKDGLAFWERLLHPDDAKRTGEIITAHINGETPLYKVEYRMRRADGSWMWSMAVGRIAEHDENGKPIKFNGVNLDIDDARKAQEELNNQKNFINSVMNTQQSFVITSDGKCLRTANKAFFDFYNVADTDEFIEKYGDCICDTFDTTAPSGYIQKQMGDEQWIEYIYNRPDIIHKTRIQKDGLPYIFTITTDKLIFNNEEIKTAVFTNVTELEKAKEEVEKILANILLPVLITSKKDRKILYANKYAEIQYEKPVEEIIGSDIDNIYTVVGQHYHIVEAIKQYGRVENMEENFRTSNGKEFTALLSVTPISYKSEDSYIGMVTDITKQKAMENEVRAIHKHTRESIEYAALIQHALIPSNDLFRNYFSDYLTIWHPKDIVGGDIYLFEELRNTDECLLMVIDCTGHGVPGAFVTMLEKQLKGKLFQI